MKRIEKIDISAPILPKKGIGKIYLGINISSFYYMVHQDYEQQTKYKHWNYRFGKNGGIGLIILSYKSIIDFYFNTASGTLGGILLKKGYKGKLFNKIRVGDKCDKIFKVFDTDDFDVADGYLGFSSDLIFKIGDNDDFLSKEEVIKRRIKEIWIRDLEII